MLLEFIPQGSPLVTDSARRFTERARKRGAVLRREDVDQEPGLRVLSATVADDPLAALPSLTQRTRQYLRALLARYGRIPEPRVTVTTIHGAKGREAPVVVLVPDMTRTTHEAYMRGSSSAREAETRVAYVGVTRAKERLIVVNPHTRRYFDFPVVRS